MLIFNFTRIFRARGIDKPFSYLVKAGYSDNFATRVANSKMERLNLKDVEKLCVLLQCTPNDILEWIPDKKEAKIEKHPLNTLKRTGSVTQLSQILNAVPLDKLGEIETLIMKELKKE
ncbi:MAG: helix-turn-helix transcriptional regulator [Bacteroidales bacterium]|nr:helix-turn-helix transcriptional regulator [Bacteroidales bacterium]